MTLQTTLSSSHSEVDPEKKIDTKWKQCYCNNTIFANSITLFQFSVPGCLFESYNE